MVAYLNCRYHEKELPSEGEIVVGKISKVTELGVFIQIIEYGNIEGLIVVGELTRKRINNAQKAVKTGKIEVAMVSRVDKEKKYIDLSRIKVSNEERIMCLQSHYKSKTAHNTMITIAQKLGMDLLDLYKNFGWPKSREYRSLYEYFAEVLNNTMLVSGHEFEKQIIEGISLRFSPRRIKIIAEIKLNCPTKRGIHSIKESLMEAVALDKDIDVSLIKPPIYSISKNDYDSKKGIKTINNACDMIKNKILSLGGSFSVVKSPVVIGDEKILNEIEDLSSNKGDSNES